MLLVLVACSDFDLTKVEEDVDAGERVIDVDPGEVDFGTVSGGTVSEVLTITSVGELPLTVADVQVSGSTTFSLTWTGLETGLEPGSSMDVIVNYSPATPTDTADVIVISDATEPRIAVPLRGAGLYPAILVDPPSVSFLSEGGEFVEEQVWVESVGTMDLQISDMVVTGAQFGATGAIPITLPPGDGTWLTVRYTPLAEGETVAGELWLATNTVSGYALVPLAGQNGIPCMGLGEAWDRGFIDIRTSAAASDIIVRSDLVEDDLCIDQWYVVLSEGSQDAGLGDPNYDLGGAYPLGTLLVGPGSQLNFRYSQPTNPAWWCMEEYQYTDGNQPYDFTGAHVPEPILGYMLDNDQEAIWDYQDNNPVMIAARDTNYVGFADAGGSQAVTVRILNMGSESGTAEVWESIPAGMTATDFSPEPLETAVNGDGTVSYRFEVELGARQPTGTDTDTIYDYELVRYALESGPCDDRVAAPELVVLWEDSSGNDRISTANPLVVRCE